MIPPNLFPVLLAAAAVFGAGAVWAGRRLDDGSPPRWLRRLDDWLQRIADEEKTDG